MKPLLPQNPFAVNSFLGKDLFCDRRDVIKEIIKKIKNGNSISFISMRRIGKTGVLHLLNDSLPPDIKMVYVDILGTSSMEDFLETISTALVKQFPEKSRFGKVIWTFIKSLRPILNFNLLTTEAQVSFKTEKGEAEKKIDAIFNFLEHQDYKIIIAIDEFQQILNYDKKNVDAWLRTRVQQLNNVHFIFSGSAQHLMNELFLHPDRPFYRSTEIIRLQKIDQQIYLNFIMRLFSKYNRAISKEITQNILDWCDTHTFYVQQLCNRVFALDKEVVEDQDWRLEANQLLKENEHYFFSLREILTKKQWFLLLAIAGQNKVYQPTAQVFIKENDLPSSATILKSLKTLLRIGIVYKDYDQDGTSYYGVYDLYMRRWCENRKRLKS